MPEKPNWLQIIGRTVAGLTDALAIVDRFEREWRQEFENIRTEATSCSHQRLKELLQRTVSDLLS